MVLAQRQALVGGKPVELALGIEDQVDPAHRLVRQRRPGGLFLRDRAAAVLAMSASTKNLRRPWLQHAASVIGPGLRSAS